MELFDGGTFMEPDTGEGIIVMITGEEVMSDGL